MNILEMAISMEYDLEKYYKEQAELNKGNELHNTFVLLAKEEENHVKILQQYQDKVSFELEDEDMFEESRKVFRNIEDFKSEIKNLPSQLDSYRMALEKEKDSLVFYQKQKDDTEDLKLKEVFSYLIKQEDRHSQVLEQLIQMLTNPEEWVESAEFGIRKEY